MTANARRKRINWLERLVHLACEYDDAAHGDTDTDATVRAGCRRNAEYHEYVRQLAKEARRG